MNKVTNLNLLLITGQSAKNLVKKYCRESKINCDVEVLPISVAALLKPRQILVELKKKNIRNYDMILIPGLISGDASIIDEIGIPVFKGPRYAVDIPFVIDLIDSIKLSKTSAADVLLKEELQRRAVEEIEKVDRNRNKLLKYPWNIEIGNCPIGRDFPVKIMAEIVDAPLLTNEEIIRKANYYTSSGADIIDIGMIAGECRPKDATRAVKALKSSNNIPISIDTLDPEEVKAAVLAGADIILSVDGGNVEDIASFAADTNIVVIPTNFRKQIFPKDPYEKIKSIESNIKQARSMGLNKVVADLILDPVISPGVTHSIVAFYEFNKRNPNIPLLMGVGNVTELMDADTVGVNALLTGLASELGVGILLSTEVGYKAKGSIKELSLSSRLMFLAKKRNSVPKDLGLDVLFLKEKKLKEEIYDKELEKDAKVIISEKDRIKKIDPKGYFKIFVDRDEDLIITLFYPNYNINQCSMIFKGKEPEEIYQTILRKRLISHLDHAAYIGRELMKAQIALQTGRNYLQDAPIFA